jgi:putative component of membrane protein insertase Oxa1/YidC/SpoIIIJ protein YidD
MFFRILFVLCFAQTLGAEPPWGVDAELVEPVHQKLEDPKPGPLNQMAQKMIWFHKKVISPADGPRSHFHPSSSMYALQAIKKYGILRGIPMGCDRLMRENEAPWIYRYVVIPDGRTLKWNPVP